MTRPITGIIFLVASALLSTLFLAQVAQTSTWELGKPEQFESGIKATAAVSADFDKDGYTDLALTDANNKAVVFLNKRPASLYSWSLEKSGSYDVGRYPVAIGAAALSGTGNIDLVTANFLSNNVSVLRGEGNGTFSPKTDYAAGPFPTFVGLYDFGNGRRDAYTTTTTSGQIAVLMNDGSGSFLPPAPDPLGSHSLTAVVDSCAAGQFDSDAYPDMAVLYHYSDDTGPHCELRVYKGIGDGQFDLVNKYALPSECDKLVSANFNSGDAYDDLAVLSNADNRVYIFTCGGDEAFTQGIPLDTPVSATGPTDILAAFVNNDGLWDIAVSSGGTTVSVYLGNGDGTFQPRRDIFVPGGSRWLAYSTLSDLNGDGLPDIITGDTTQTNFSVLPGILKFTLTTSASPEGGGTVSPGDDYLPGTVVDVTATPDAHYAFAGWTGPVADPDSASTTVTMDADAAVTANFVKNGIKLSKTQTGRVLNLSAEYHINGAPPVDGTVLKCHYKYSLDGVTWPAAWSTKTLGKTLNGVVNRSLKAKVGYYKFQAFYAPKGQTPVYDIGVIDCKVQPVVVLTGPADKTATADPDPAISWQAYDGAIGYDVQIAATKKFTTLLGTNSYAQWATSGTLPSLTAMAGVKTYWRVVARLSDGTSTSVGSTPRRIIYTPAP